MKRWLYIVLLWLPLALHAQQDTILFHPDTVSLHNDSAFFHTDSVHHEEYRYYVDLTKKPDAIKAVWLGAILPGAGQIYNKSYWKLPIVYGAFMGCGYAISFNNDRYLNYKRAYKDLYLDTQNGTVSEDASKSYIAVLPEGYDLDRVGGSSTWLNTLKNQQNIYRRYRDYSILATVIVYALTLIDAYVDAQLFDFDISPDLSLNVEPQIILDDQLRRSTELKLAIRF